MWADPSKHRFNKRFARGSIHFSLPRFTIGKIDLSVLKPLFYVILIFCLLTITVFSGWVAINIVQIERQKMLDVNKKLEYAITPIKCRLDELDDQVQYLDAHKQPIVIYTIKEKIPVRVRRK